MANKYKRARLVPNFGQYHIKLDRLADNQLTVQQSNYAFVGEPELISMDLRDLLIELIETHKLRDDIYLGLCEVEQKLLQLIIKKAKFDYMIYTRLTDMHHKRYKDALIQKLRLAQGEIIAGNNNPILLDELIQVLNELLQHNWIQKKFYDKMISDFS